MGNGSVTLASEENAQFLRLPVDAGGNISVSGEKLRLEPGKPYTFSALVRCREKDMEGSVLFVNARWKQTERYPIRVTDKWERIEATFTPQFDDYFVVLGFRNLSRQEAEVDVDSTMLEQGTQAGKYSQEEGVFSGIFCPSTTGGVFFPEETAVFRAQVGFYGVNARKQRPDRVTLKMTDYLGKTVLEKDQQLDWDGKTVCEVKLEPPRPMRPGLYTVRAEWRKSDGTEIKTDLATCAVAAALPEALEPDATPYSGVCGPVPRGAERIGVRWVEVGRHWNELAGNRDGVIDHDPLQRTLEQLKKRGFFIKFSLLHQPATPEFARDPEHVAEAASWGMKPGKNILPSEAGVASFGRFIEQIIRRHGDFIDLLELGGEDDLIVGVEPYYRKKYPEHVVNGHVGGPVSAAIGKMGLAGIRAARAVKPDLEIAVGRPCGNDCDSNDYSFSRGVVSAMGNSFDLFSMDAYARRSRFIGDPNGIYGYPDDDFDTVRERTVKMLREEGAPGKGMFISEYGFALDYHYPPDHPMQQEMIKRVARALLLGRAVGWKYFFWFYTTYFTENGVYNYGMWNGNDPTAVVPAYAMAASVAENVKQVTRLTAIDNVQMLLFPHKTRTVAVLWAIHGHAAVKLNVPAGIRMLDVMGGELPLPANGIFELGELPIYLELAGTDAKKPLKTMLNSATDLSFPVQVSLQVNSIDENGARIVVEPLNKNAAGSIRIRATSGNGDNLPEQKLELTPQSKRRLLPYRIAPGNQHTRIVVTSDRGLKKQFDFTTEISRWPRKESKLWSFHRREQIEPPDPHVLWSGPADLSATGYASQEGKLICLKVAVADDAHFNRQKGTLIWNGDCLQLAFSARPVKSERNQADYGDDDTEIMLALTTEGPQLAFVHGDASPLQDGESFSVTRNEQKRETVYLLKLSRTRLKIGNQGRPVFGFDCVLFDDDDGAGQSYRYELSPGITGGNKVPGLFPWFYLE